MVFDMVFWPRIPFYAPCVFVPFSPNKSLRNTKEGMTKSLSPLQRISCSSLVVTLMWPTWFCVWCLSCMTPHLVMAPRTVGVSLPFQKAASTCQKSTPAVSTPLPPQPSINAQKTMHYWYSMLPAGLEWHWLWYSWPPSYISPNPVN